MKTLTDKRIWICSFILLLLYFVSISTCLAYESYYNNNPRGYFHNPDSVASQLHEQRFEERLYREEERVNRERRHRERLEAIRESGGQPSRFYLWPYK